MNKATLHQCIKSALKALQENAEAAAQQAHDTATHEEAVAENKYDTFGLEASYLAEGQSKRVQQARDDRQTFDKLAIRDFDEDSPIHFGAYLELTSLELNSLELNSLELSDDELQTQKLFLSPVAGGLQITMENERIMLVSPHSPLGQALMGAYLDDEITVNNRRYTITKLS